MRKFDSNPVELASLGVGERNVASSLLLVTAFVSEVVAGSAEGSRVHVIVARAGNSMTLAPPTSRKS